MEKILLRLLDMYDSTYYMPITYNNSNTGTAYQQQTEENESYLTIRGSDKEFVDWFWNIVPPLISIGLWVMCYWFIWLVPIAYSSSVVHWGFVLRGCEVYWNIDKSADTYYLYGFSLGGALSIVVGVLLVISGKKVFCFTSGAPKPFSIISIFNIFLFKFKIFRHFQNKGDPVCKMAPWWLGYIHFGEKIKAQVKYEHGGMSHSVIAYRKFIMSHL